MTQSTNTSKKELTVFLLTHLYAAITGVIALAYWFTFRELVGAILIVSNISTWSWQFIDLVAFISYGLAWLILVLACQHYYAKQMGARKCRVPKLFIRISVVQAVIFAISATVIYIMNSM